LYLLVPIPSSYRDGSPVTVKIIWSCASTSGDALINAVATLVRSEVDVYTTTTNQRTTTNTAITLTASNTNEPQKVDLDVTDSDGEVNSVAVSARDFLKIQIS